MENCRHSSQVILSSDLQALIGDDGWALALEVAIGKLLNAFVVTSHRDMLLLRDCAKSCGYYNLQIIIYDYDRPL